ncbi:hypothetical protein BGZ99_001864 [Dissophora globulifera]|uniref:Uncharacterized protein n=1 Tax=Dissophora globulifera TaxID=979702 RepID=A0A9P6RWF9_9FUNG|nr:hypothetical protein BGZ99_001864 [Dissophora globulifera]
MAIDPQRGTMGIRGLYHVLRPIPRSSFYAIYLKTDVLDILKFDDPTLLHYVKNIYDFGIARNAALIRSILMSDGNTMLAAYLTAVTTKIKGTLNPIMSNTALAPDLLKQNTVFKNCLKEFETQKALRVTNAAVLHANHRDNLSFYKARKFKRNQFRPHITQGSILSSRTITISRCQRRPAPRQYPQTKRRKQLVKQNEVVMKKNVVKKKKQLKRAKENPAATKRNLASATVQENQLLKNYRQSVLTVGSIQGRAGANRGLPNRADVKAVSDRLLWTIRVINMMQQGTYEIVASDKRHILASSRRSCVLCQSPQGPPGQYIRKLFYDVSHAWRMDGYHRKIMMQGDRRPAAAGRRFKLCVTICTNGLILNLLVIDTSKSRRRPTQALQGDDGQGDDGQSGGGQNGKGKATASTAPAPAASASVKRKRKATASAAHAASMPRIPEWVWVLVPLVTPQAHWITVTVSPSEALSLSAGSQLPRSSSPTGPQLLPRPSSSVRPSSPAGTQVPAGPPSGGSSSPSSSAISDDSDDENSSDGSTRHLRFQTLLKEAKDAAGIDELESNIPPMTLKTLDQYFHYMSTLEINGNKEVTTNRDRMLLFCGSQCFARKSGDMKKMQTECTT